MERRTVLKSLALVPLTAHLPFSPAPRLDVDTKIDKDKYLHYEMVDWLNCRLILFDERNKPMWSPLIATACASKDNFPVALMSFYRPKEDMKISAIQFVDKDGKVPEPPKPMKVSLVTNNTFHCTYIMETSNGQAKLSQTSRPNFGRSSHSLHSSERCDRSSANS